MNSNRTHKDDNMTKTDSTKTKRAPMSSLLTGFLGQVSPATALFALPIALWEFSLGIYLVVKGFRPSLITAGM